MCASASGYHTEVRKLLSRPAGDGGAFEREADIDCPKHLPN
jgi:hypothetical protein